MSDNQTKFDQGMARIMGALPGIKHRDKWRLADEKDIQDVPSAVLNQPVPWYGFDGKTQPEGARRTTTLAAFIGWIDSGLNTLMRAVNNANEGIAGLTAAVKALSEKQGVDPAALEQLIDKAVSEAAAKHLSDIGTYELRKVEHK